MGYLFPALPDDLGRACLLRVGLSSHHNLRCVSKTWNAVLKSPSFYADRKKLKISEERICFLQKAGNTRNRILIYDLEKGSYKILPSIPIQIDCHFHCHFVKQKLFLISDVVSELFLISDLVSDDTAGNRVCVYDFVDLKWRECARMPRRMNGFASAVDTLRGLIYVAGGYDSYDDYFDKFGDPVRSASVYNVEKDKWEDLPDMNISKNSSPSIPFLGTLVYGKFCVTKYNGGFQVYYPTKRIWDNQWPSHSPSNLLSAFGFLYFFLTNGVYELDVDGSYRRVSSMPDGDKEYFINFSIVINNKIFVCKWVGKEGLNGFYTLTPGEAFHLTRIEMPMGLHEFVMGGATLDL